eukprot:5538434-Alexandrium_andersonii.AAC.1
MAERRPRKRALPAGALDLRPGPGGQSWNFDFPGDRERAIRFVASRKPFLLIGSPPCTDWCGLMPMSITREWTSRRSPGVCRRRGPAWSS